MLKKILLPTLIILFGIILVGCGKLASNGTGNGNHGHNISVDSEEHFLTTMIPHHQEAIDSSTLVVARSENLDLLPLAQKIIQVQSAEIEQMQNWLAERYPEVDHDHDYENMMPDLSMLEGVELERAYLEGMIAHHEGAIQMANDVLMLNVAERKPEIDTLAKDIKATQAAEIAQMKEMLANLE